MDNLTNFFFSHISVSGIATHNYIFFKQMKSSAVKTSCNIQTYILISEYIDPAYIYQKMPDLLKFHWGYKRRSKHLKRRIWQTPSHLTRFRHTHNRQYLHPHNSVCQFLARKGVFKWFALIAPKILLKTCMKYLQYHLHYPMFKGIVLEHASYHILWRFYATNPSIMHKAPPHPPTHISSWYK